jgi:hypothetical protein
LSDGLLFLGAVTSFIVAIRFSRKAIKEHVTTSRKMFPVDERAINKDQL